MITKSHTFVEMTAEMRPQADDGLTFEALELGGEYPDQMPQAIHVKDQSGRWCIYLPTREDGKVVQSHGFDMATK